MKNINKLFAIAIVILGFSATSYAQSNATASSTATLVVPLSISNTSNLDFGVLASSALAGTVQMAFNGAITPTGGASAISGTPTTATFHVTGAGTESISVSYPASIPLAGVPSGSLLLNTITADCGTSTNLVGGVKDIKFSAVLEIPANTVAGTYSNAAGLAVTVNYN